MQDVQHRWRASYRTFSSFQESMTPLMLYESADSWKENRFSSDDWERSNQSAALLHGLAAASDVLEGDSYGWRGALERFCEFGVLYAG